MSLLAGVHDEMPNDVLPAHFPHTWCWAGGLESRAAGFCCWLLTLAKALPELLTFAWPYQQGGSKIAPGDRRCGPGDTTPPPRQVPAAELRWAMGPEIAAHRDLTQPRSKPLSQRLLCVSLLVPPQHLWDGGQRSRVAMYGVSPASPDGSRSLLVPCRDSRCSGSSWRKEAGHRGGTWAWASAGEVARKSLLNHHHLLNHGGSEVPPSQTFATSLLQWVGGTPAPATHSQTSCLGAVPCPGCTSRPHPPQGLPQTPQPRAPFRSHPWRQPCLRPAPSPL